MHSDTGHEQSLKPLRLDFESKQQVLVVTDNEDRFLTTSKEAALACKQQDLSKEWKVQFEQFLGYINEWAKEREDRVSEVYLAVGSEGLTVFVVTKGTDYQFDFDDEITELDINVAAEFDHCPATIYQIPSTPIDALSSFFSTESSLQIYGQ